MAAGRSWERPSWQRYFGMTPRQMERLRGIVREEIAERPLTREELIEAVGRRRGFKSVAEGPALRLGHAAEADRLAGRPRLRPERRDARDLHHAAGSELALGRPPRTGRGGTDRDPRLPRRVRPRDGRGVLRSGSPAAGSAGLGCVDGSRSSATRSSRSTWTATEPGSSPSMPTSCPRPSRPPPSACSPDSTSSCSAPARRTAT